MKTLLHLNSSPRGNYSVSRKLSSEVVAAWKAKNPRTRNHLVAAEPLSA
jgi:FMN-dependent NADH-azoreductase